MLPTETTEIKQSSPKTQGTDCALIFPPWTVLQGRSYLANRLPPLGVLSIAGYLLKFGFEVQVIDVNGERMGPDQLRTILRESHPRYIGISVLSSSVVSAHCIAKLVKEELPQSIVVMGGVHAELYPGQTLRNSAVDIVVKGDGERPMADIVGDLPWDKIPGISYIRDDGTMQHNPLGDVQMDLDEYGIPAYHLVNFGTYYPSATTYRNLPAINIIMTRGCPGKCTFCNSAMTTLRSRSPQSVFDQIKLLRNSYGIRQIQFYDDTFTINRRAVFELCRLLTESEVGISFCCYVRGDCFDDNIAKALKGAGCHQIMMGIESGSEKIRGIIDKPVPKERYASVVKIARANGLEVRAGFIIGNIGETWETMEESLQFAIDLDIDFLQLNINTPYPGTALFRQALQENRLKHMILKDYGFGEPIVELDDLSASQIKEFERHAWRRFYLRPRMMLKQLRRVTNFRQTMDLFNAFRLFILGFAPGEEPNWSEWDQPEEEMYDLPGLEDSDALTCLTYEVRQGINIARAEDLEVNV
jgi:radical SAM superfamily enzyme YgiQ (UPF0313 family)